MKICRRKTEDLDDVIPKPESYYADQLREHAKRAPVPKMLSRTEEKILSYVPKRLRQQYPAVLASYMADVHEDFDKVMKAFSCQKIFKPAPDDYVPPREKFEFKRLGRTANYKHFLKHKAAIQKNLLIPHPFIRCIIHYSYTDLPPVLNDYTKYRMKEEITLNELRDMAKKELQGCNNFIAQEWYPKITRILKKHYDRRTLPKSMWLKVISCASGLINRQLNELKLRTIEHLRQTVLNVHKIPQMKIIAICDDGFVDLFPSLNDIYSVYQNAIEDIATVGSRLDPLENMIDAQAFVTKANFMKIGIGEISLREAHDALQLALEETFEPLATYLKDFQEQFAGLISRETQDELNEFLSEPRSFEEYLEKIDQFQVYNEKIKNMVMKEYFYVAIVNQSDAIGSVRKMVREYIERIASNIAVEHRKESQRICREFEEIKDRALEIPSSTEQLMANGEYMTRAKTEVIEELREKIQESMRVGL